MPFLGFPRGSVESAPIQQKRAGGPGGSGPEEKTNTLAERTGKHLITNKNTHEHNEKQKKQKKHAAKSGVSRLIMEFLN